MEKEKRKLERKKFSYYMRVMDDASGLLMGHISDFSSGGFKVEFTQLLALNVDYRLRLEQLGVVSNESARIFNARTIWCRPDQDDPNLYTAGFKLVGIAAEDRDVFLTMFNTFRAKSSS